MAGRAGASPRDGPRAPEQKGGVEVAISKSVMAEPAARDPPADRRCSRCCLFAAGSAVGWLPHRPLDRPHAAAWSEMADRGRQGRPHGERCDVAVRRRGRHAGPQLRTRWWRTCGASSTTSRRRRCRWPPPPARSPPTPSSSPQGAQSQAQAAEETSTSMEEMAASIQTVAGNAQSLATYVEETSSSITEMGASIEEVAKSSARPSPPPWPRRPPPSRR